MGLDPSNFIRGANRAENAMGGMEKRMNMVKSVATKLTGVFAALGAGAGALKALQIAADFEKTEVGINTMLKNLQATRGLLNELVKLSAQTPLELPELTGAARTMLGGGFKLGTLVTDLKMLGDVSSGAQTDIGGLAIILNQVRGKGKLYAEELQQLAERGVAGLREELAKVRGTSVEQLFDDMQKGEVVLDDLMAAFRNMTSEGGMFFNAMQLQSRTTYGLISTLKDNISEMVRIFSQPINDGPLKSVLDGAITKVDELSGKARSFAMGLSVAFANEKLGTFLFNSLALGFARAANYGERVLRGALHVLSESSFLDALLDPGLWQMVGNYATLALREAAAHFAEALFGHLRELNKVLPRMMRMDDAELNRGRMNARVDADNMGAARSMQGINIQDYFKNGQWDRRLNSDIKKAVERFNEGFNSAPDMIDTSGFEAQTKDIYTVARILFNNMMGEQKKALEDLSTKTGTANTALKNLNSTMNNVGGAAAGAGNRTGGGPGQMPDNMGAPGSGYTRDGRKRIVTFDAAQSAARRFMRLSPAAQKNYDGSFDEFFGKGPKVGPQEAMNRFMNNDAGAAAARDMMRRRGSPEGFRNMGEFINSQSGRFFNGLPGERGAANGGGRGTSVLEQLLKDVVTEMKGVNKTLAGVKSA